MIAISLFYLLFLILLILLIFLILIYTGYHTRTLVPPLLDNFYGITGINNTSIGTSYQDLYLNDGANDYSSQGVSGSLDFGTSGATTNIFAFRPMRPDSQRKLRGNITILISKQNSSINNMNFRLLDEGDNKVVSDGTNFEINPYSEGLTEIKLYFDTNVLENNNRHRFVLQGNGTSTSISANQYLVNSAYMYYY